MKTRTEPCPRCRTQKPIEQCYCAACEKEINLKVFGLPEGKTLVIQAK